MQELKTLARPYARAAFAVAQEKGESEQWQPVLSGMAAASEHPKVKELLTSPREDRVLAVEKFLTLFPDADVPANLAGLIRVLGRNARLGLLPEIAELFKGLQAQARQSTQVEVTTAIGVDQSDKGDIVKALSKMFDGAISPIWKIDEAIIGGFIARSNDRVVDASLRGRVNKLAETLKGSRQTIKT